MHENRDQQASHGRVTHRNRWLTSQLRQFGNPPGGAGKFEGVHAGVCAIDDIDISPVIHFHVVRLDRGFATLIRARPHTTFVGLLGNGGNVITPLYSMTSF